MKRLKNLINNFKNKKHLFRLAAIIMLVILAMGIFGFAHNQAAPVAPSPAKYQDFHLEIPKLNINAPIIPDVPGGDNDKEAYFKALEGGVAHYAGTKKPGEGGLIFIFGHSSFYPWAAGDYKEIFRDLEKVELGDEIFVWSEQKEFKYKVVEIKVVMPDNVSVLAPTNFEQLTLMTCVPPGTKEKRLIVNARPAE